MCLDRKNTHRSIHVYYARCVAWMEKLTKSTIPTSPNVGRDIGKLLHVQARIFSIIDFVVVLPTVQKHLFLHGERL